MFVFFCRRAVLARVTQDFELEALTSARGASDDNNDDDGDAAGDAADDNSAAALAAEFGHDDDDDAEGGGGVYGFRRALRIHFARRGAALLARWRDAVAQPSASAGFNISMTPLLERYERVLAAFDRARRRARRRRAALN